MLLMPCCGPPWPLQGEMREYQLQGLQWMVKQHDNGMNMILADEMVRCQIAAWPAFRLCRVATGGSLAVSPGCRAPV